MNQENKLFQRDLKSLIKSANRKNIIGELDDFYSSFDYVNISLDQIEEYSIFRNVPINQNSVKSTIDDISKNRIYNPVVLRKNNNNKYEVIVGRRRYYACKKLNINSLKSIVLDVSDEECCLLCLFNALEKHNKNIIEIAVLFNYLKDLGDYTLEKLSELTRVSVSQIANYIRLLKFSKDIQKLIANNEISFGIAKLLCSLDEDSLNEIIISIKEKDCSVKEAEKLINTYKKGKRYNTNSNKLTRKYKLTNLYIGKKTLTMSFQSNKDLEKFINKIK